jgi:hypothetical protein
MDSSMTRKRRLIRAFSHKGVGIERELQVRLVLVRRAFEPVKQPISLIATRTALGIRTVPR